MGSSLRAFQLAQNEHRTLSLNPLREAQKRKTADFRKNRTSLEESLLQSFFVWKLSEYEIGC